ncbi:hypothetical protein [Nodosilinea sp. E11]|uniref:hypothetical protein n=1 Tax=Nodosilinea sp. E11 TaxID=3037479 RepID=UPI0029347B30|nr:hypothetical protein [Nodosilinea sp. E11]WOD41049.1 hypothetical protein RRF56_09610 [Nodosilinea sp. E11]
MKIKINGITSLADSNRFLRALWAELRKQFGKFAWNYQPSKDGTSQTIFLGWGNGIPISLLYSQKSIVNGVLFGNGSSEPVDEASELGLKLKQSVVAALQHRNIPKTEILEVPISSLYSSLAPYKGEWLEILPGQRPISLLTVRVKAFDETDAKTELFRISSFILDVLSIETNNMFWIDSQKQDKVYELKLGTEEAVCPEVNTSPNDEEWIDTYPSHNGYMLISNQAIQFLDRILSKDELSSTESLFIRSCHHYHMARIQDALIYNRLYSPNSQPNDEPLGIILEEDPRFKEAPIFAGRANEIATVLYMSAIEVVSMIDANPSEKCTSCGQEQYRISARVAEYVNKYDEGGHLSKVFKSLYSKRSKYLHAGALLSDHAYVGTTIPKLDPSSDSGMSEMISVPVINLREWTGYMLRQQLKSLLLAGGL